MNEHREELKAANTTPNGNVRLNAQPAPSARDRSIGRVCEILAVIALAVCIFIYGLATITAKILGTVLIALAVLMYKLAIRYAVRVETAEKALGEEEKARAQSLRYKVTDVRLRTLEEVGVPQDVRAALAKLAEQSPLPEEQFLAELALNSDTDLGWERTNEFRGEILKYTKVDVDRKSLPPPSRNAVILSIPAHRN
jgi:hypothetical protein